MRRNLQIVPITGILLICLFCSCTKKHTAEVDNETQSVADYSQIQNEFLSLASAVFNHANHTAGIGSSVQCDSLRLLSGDRNFGGAGHINPVFSLDLDKPCTISTWDGKTRAGTIQVRVTAPVSQLGSQMSIFLSGYFVNGASYACDSVVLKTIAVTKDSTTFDLKVIRGVAASEDFTIRYSLSGIMVAYPPESPATLKNQLRFWGSASGTNRQGTNFSAEAFSASPEKKMRSCKYISSGVTKVIPSGFKERMLDYGDGTCDDDASFDVDNNTIAIRLK
jgi:hypothetical protein